MHVALALETNIRKKESDLRERMKEKVQILQKSKMVDSAGEPMTAPTLQHLAQASANYFEAPLTKRVNLRSVLQAHSSNLSRNEMNQIVWLHNSACYEEPYAKSLVQFC